jgi:sucrose-6-phosphate hydrolase SacC (GH32 family)
MATSKSQQPGTPGVTFYTSTDLKNWKYQSWIENCHECPELFRLPVDRNADKQKWMMYGNAGPYYIGEFDGKSFRVDFGPYKKQSGGACQTWSNAPDGRRIELGMAGRAQGMPSLGIQTLPVEVTLRTMPDGTIRSFKYPVRELEMLRTRKLVERSGERIEPGTMDLVTVEDDMIDIVAEFELDQTALDAGVRFGFSYRGRLACYDAQQPEMFDVEVKPRNGKIALRIVVDRVIHEAFFNDGLLYQRGFHDYRDPDPDRTLRLFVENAPVRLKKLIVYELGRAGWKPFTSRQLIQHPVAKGVSTSGASRPKGTRSTIPVPAKR